MASQTDIYSIIVTRPRAVKVVISDFISNPVKGPEGLMQKEGRLVFTRFKEFSEDRATQAFSLAGRNSDLMLVGRNCYLTALGHERPDNQATPAEDTVPAISCMCAHLSSTLECQMATVQ